MKNMNTVQAMSAPSAHLHQEKTLEHVKAAKRVWTYAVLALMSGYVVRLIYSASAISVQEKNIVFASVALVLLMAIPVIGLNIYFASRRSALNTTYSPRASHSMKKETVAWVIPIIIVAVVTSISWGLLHSLDLYKPVKLNAVSERVIVAAHE